MRGSKVRASGYKTNKSWDVVRVAPSTVLQGVLGKRVDRKSAQEENRACTCVCVCVVTM